MFSQLSDRLSNSLNKIRGIGRLTEKNIHDDVRDALGVKNTRRPGVSDFEQ